ncbi:RNA polymerase sigma-70 factor [Cytophagaceae bacterium DM2B3-1]|uniref:RNA polymerase sigma-70 factor n=1 Tax=Xanthocytophaga flava TaxID=3048013 RepID=A0ABT7CYS5_9BACT|nr:RNA polymerase sigma-70 factor [Xanthocytophaga flavus]MDJ1498095.1 RNA polymerase sigma-70 factor [Xanthocytophaga flavus]
MKHTHNSPPDMVLISDWQQGDEKAFDKLYYRYHPRLFRLAFKITKSQSLTEEIVHDAFMKVWQNKDKIDPQRSFQAYIFTIIKNDIYRYLRKQTNSLVTVNFSSGGVTPNSNPTEHDLHFTDYFQLYQYALNTLPARKKEIFLLHRQEEMSYREIASQLQVSIKTVEFHMNDCFKWFRKNFRMYTDLVFLFLSISYIF